MGKKHKYKRNQSDPFTKFIIFSFGIIGVFLLGMAVYFGVYERGNVEELASTNTIEHQKGSALETIVVTEYADLQCPACAQYHSFMNSYMEEYGNRVTFRYRHFPLNSIHSLADEMSRYSVATYLQSESHFWDFLDFAYENQSTWRNFSSSRLETYLYNGFFSDLDGFSFDLLKEDLNSDVVTAKVAADRLEASSIGARGTPTFTVNGQRIDTPRPVREEWNNLLGIN